RPAGAGRAPVAALARPRQPPADPAGQLPRADPAAPVPLRRLPAPRRSLRGPLRPAGVGRGGAEYVAPGAGEEDRPDAEARRPPLCQPAGPQRDRPAGRGGPHPLGGAVRVTGRPVVTVVDGAPGPARLAAAGAVAVPPPARQPLAGQVRAAVPAGHLRRLRRGGPDRRMTSTRIGRR